MISGEGTNVGLPALPAATMDGDNEGNGVGGNDCNEGGMGDLVGAVVGIKLKSGEDG